MGAQECAPVVTSRFLLDEHLSPIIADQLVTRSIDVVAVSSRPDLRTLPDPDILEAAASEARVLVTRNIGNFIRLDDIWGSSGRRHPGILCVATRKYPENSAFVGAMTAALVAWADSGRDITGTYSFL